jgi:hypothetical protein
VVEIAAFPRLRLFEIEGEKLGGCERFLCDKPPKQARSGRRLVTGMGVIRSLIAFRLVQKKKE